MKIACIGYILGDNKITVSYDTVNKMFVVDEEYKDVGVRTGFNYSVKSKKEVRDVLERFKSFPISKYQHERNDHYEK